MALAARMSAGMFAQGRPYAIGQIMWEGRDYPPPTSPYISVALVHPLRIFDQLLLASWLRRICTLLSSINSVSKKSATR